MYVKRGIPLTDEYLVQCEAGFIVPEIVNEAVAKHAPEGSAFQKTCVPSLHIAAGYAKDDVSPFTNYPHDVIDPLNVNYCRKGGRRQGEKCEPLPICDNNGQSPSLPPSKEVKYAKECDKACKYLYAATYDDCVFLDISNPGEAISYFTARRALSGPYAVLMDEEENLLLGAVEETPASKSSTAAEVPDASTATSTTNGTEGEHFSHNIHETFSSEFNGLQNSRNRRQATERIQYPRCIDISGLADEDRRRVEADTFLDCNKNLFVQFRNGDTSGLILNPPSCQGSNDSRICANRDGTTSASPPNVTTTAAALVSSEMLVWLGAGGAGVFLLIICGVILSCTLKRKKQEEDLEKVAVVSQMTPAVPEPPAAVPAPIPVVAEPAPAAPKPVADVVEPTPAAEAVQQTPPAPKSTPDAVKSKSAVVDPTQPDPEPSLKKPQSGIVDLAQGRYQLIASNIDGGHKAHLKTMTEGTPRPLKCEAGRYDLAARGFALRIDLEKLQGNQVEPAKEWAPRSFKRKVLNRQVVAQKIVDELGKACYVEVDDGPPFYNPSADELKALCDSVGLSFEAEKGVARPKGRTMVVGDIHGNLNDLWRAIHAWLSDVVDKGPKQNIVFLGNIVDVGPRQLECLTLILAYKTLFPNQVWMIRGRNEDATICKAFEERLALREYSGGVFRLFAKLFANMPNVGLIDGRILCVHGMLTLDLTKKLLKNGWDPQQYETMNKQLRWNVPSEKVEFCEPNVSRDYGNRLGPKAIKEAMERLGVEFVIRSNHVMTNGVQRFGDIPVATVFTASFFEKEKNLGAILFVDPEQNAIIPIFLVNVKDTIKTQEEFDKKLADGWKVDNYAQEKK